MNNESLTADFGMLTDDEQGMVVGGDDTVANAVGWFVGYAAACMKDALILDYKLLTKQPIIYVDGVGFV